MFSAEYTMAVCDRKQAFQGRTAPMFSDIVSLGVYELKDVVCFCLKMGLFYSNVASRLIMGELFATRA